MNFSQVLTTLASRLDAVGVRYALIGGFAMGLRGVQRSTTDLDFLLMLADLEKTNSVLESLGYRREFRSENVSHYVSPDRAWGRIDILHAFRGPSLGMLQRAEAMQVDETLIMPVLQVEDL